MSNTEAVKHSGCRPETEKDIEVIDPETVEGDEDW